MQSYSNAEEPSPVKCRCVQMQENLLQLSIMPWISSVPVYASGKGGDACIGELLPVFFFFSFCAFHCFHCFRCIMSSYSVPVGTVRVDFELPPNERRLAVDVPTHILDPNTGLVQLNDTEVEWWKTLHTHSFVCMHAHARRHTHTHTPTCKVSHYNGTLWQEQLHVCHCTSQ